ncbi:hypothetical protein J1N35_015779 [Gossypium stocksii]|uniref:Uncharacterized protein n=1 Tax=Gossypium stocksii TaxID=47602 RepID=A0A9D3VXI6_9ROSI|nr:hypothetical protein J1N35_015779 [Gossypium stocksii]
MMMTNRPSKTCWKWRERNCELSSDANKLHALRYLLILLLLQVLLQPGEFSDAASELITCCKKVILHSYGEDDLDDDTAPELTDVFRCFCGDVTDDGLLRMLWIIEKDLNPARHQQDEDKLLGAEKDEDVGEAETGETAKKDRRRIRGL